MAKNTVITRKKRGPAPTGKGQLVGVRVLPPLMAKLDGWIGKQDDSPTRPEAIRRLVEKGLSLSHCHLANLTKEPSVQKRWQWMW